MSCAPSTVYRAITRLEREIGGSLFDRDPNGWTPTDIGARIIALAETIEREAAATELLLLGRNAGLSAPLRPGGTTTADRIVRSGRGRPAASRPDWAVARHAIVLAAVRDSAAR